MVKFVDHRHAWYYHNHVQALAFISPSVFYTGTLWHTATWYYSHKLIWPKIRKVQKIRKILHNSIFAWQVYLCVLQLQATKLMQFFFFSIYPHQCLIRNRKSSWAKFSLVNMHYLLYESTATRSSMYTTELRRSWITPIHALDRTELGPAKH